ncbi:MAG TPA: hypothetical protein V6C57_10960 [Coleofasciculaceae cyanobacterium]
MKTLYLSNEQLIELYAALCGISVAPLLGEPDRIAMLAKFANSEVLASASIQIGSLVSAQMEQRSIPSVLEGDR